MRDRVIDVARSWIGTPYRHMGRIKKGGVDCLTLLAEVYEEAGLVRNVSIDYYPQDWHLHKEAERYLIGLQQYAREIKGPPLAGDIVLWRFGRCYSHGAIVIDWPIVIHAQIDVGVVYEDASKASYLTQIGEPVVNKGKERLKRFFSPW